MNAAPVGSGPFRFTEWVRGRHVILERNDDFFIEGRPLLDRIVVRFITDPAVRMLALEKGEIDYYPFAGLRFRETLRIRDNPDLRLSARGYEALGAVNYLEFNLREPPFDDPRIRRAVAYAIDQAYVVEILHGGLPHPGYGPLHHSNPFHTSDLDQYEVDLDLARALLDEAGYPPDADGVRFRAVLDYPPFHAESLGKGAAYIRLQLKKVGIAVELRPPRELRELGRAHRIMELPIHHEHALDLPGSGHWRAPHLPLRQHQEGPLVQHPGLLQRALGRAASGSRIGRGTSTDARRSTGPSSAS